jgi:hypothetical protein
MDREDKYRLEIVQIAVFKLLTLLPTEAVKEVVEKIEEINQRLHDQTMGEDQ